MEPLRDVVLETLLNAIGDGIAIAREGRIVEVNDRMCELTGLAPGELQGARLPPPFVAPEGREAFQDVVDGCRRDQWAGGEVVLRRYDGLRFPASIVMGLALDADGDAAAEVLAVKDLTEQKAYEDELARLASTDGLTGLLNQRSFHERLAGEVARARRHDRPLALVVCDLDRFKRINDRYGHPVGDDVLAEAARRMAQVIRQGESLARTGGEEFAWILPDCGLDGAFAAAERLRAQVGCSPFEVIGPQTVSAGVASLTEVDTPGDLYRRADQALYEAKRDGRDRTAALQH